jgi:hypothetical protein
MSWWIDATLLLVSGALWFLALAQGDEVIALLEKILALAALMVVVVGARPLPLLVCGVALALWLPSAASFERRERP